LPKPLKAPQYHLQQLRNQKAAYDRLYSPYSPITKRNMYALFGSEPADKQDLFHLAFAHSRLVLKRSRGNSTTFALRIAAADLASGDPPCERLD
jgi:DNA-directed RNA polymerase specialized sigma24 family protein